MNLTDYLDAIDKKLLLALNGSGCQFFDYTMLYYTKTLTWVPLMIVLLFILWKNNSWKQFLLIAVMIAVTVTICDQVASGICKPVFQRFRPSKAPDMAGLVQLVDNYKGGGLYGFCSSHASNSFGVALFLILLVRNRVFTATLLVWAAIHSYTRIYLGVHYPGDVLCGMLIGLAAGYAVYRLYMYVCRRLYNSSQSAYFYPERKYTGKEIYLVPIVFFATLSCILIIAAIH